MTQAVVAGKGSEKVHPATFEYHRPSRVDDAIGLLRQYGADAKLLAGGHSLLPVMKLRLAEPAHLIDIGRLADLRGVREDGDSVRIGALTTHHELETNAIILQRCPLLAEAAAQVGDRQVRNRGTLGGALVHADAAADEPAAVLALDAELIARGPNGERTIPAVDFFIDFLTTALEADEVLTEIRVTARTPRTGISYQKLANQASGYALVGVAAVVTLDASGQCASARVAITGATASPRRVGAVERALTDTALTATTIAEAARVAGDGLELLDDLHAPADYRLGVVRGLTRRALTTAAARAR